MTCVIPASWPAPGEELGFSVWVVSAETTLRKDLLNFLKEDGTGIIFECRGHNDKLSEEEQMTFNGSLPPGWKRLYLGRGTAGMNSLMCKPKDANNKPLRSIKGDAYREVSTMFEEIAQAVEREKLRCVLINCKQGVSRSATAGGAFVAAVAQDAPKESIAQDLVTWLTSLRPPVDLITTEQEAMKRHLDRSGRPLRGRDGKVLPLTHWRAYKWIKKMLPYLKRVAGKHQFSRRQPFPSVVSAARWKRDFLQHMDITDKRPAPQKKGTRTLTVVSEGGQGHEDTRHSHQKTRTAVVPRGVRESSVLEEEKSRLDDLSSAAKRATSAKAKKRPGKGESASASAPEVASASSAPASAPEARLTFLPKGQRAKKGVDKEAKEQPAKSDVASASAQEVASASSEDQEEDKDQEKRAEVKDEDKEEDKEEASPRSSCEKRPASVEDSDADTQKKKAKARSAQWSALMKARFRFSPFGFAF